MRLEEVDNYDYRGKVKQEVVSAMESLAGKYPFNPALMLDIMSLDDYDFADYEFPLEDQVISHHRRKGEDYVVITNSDGDHEIVPLDKILLQRRLNLISETRLHNSPEPPYLPIVQSVVVDCGFGTDIRQIMVLAQKYGFKKLWGARPSCGVQDVFAKEGLEDLDICTIGFETGGFDEKGDRIEVLYLGPGTTDIEFLHNVLMRMSEEYNFKIMDIEDL